MRRKHSGSLLYNKQQYELPNVEIHCFEENDVVRTSGNGTMDWDWTGDWTPNREDTFVG